jgi:hypothetical protein
MGCYHLRCWRRLSPGIPQPFYLSLYRLRAWGAVKELSGSASLGLQAFNSPLFQRLGFFRALPALGYLGNRNTYLGSLLVQIFQHVNTFILKTAVICHHPAAGSSFMPFSGGKTGSILL